MKIPSQRVCKLIAVILKEGFVGFSKHAKARMIERNLIEADLKNVLRNGNFVGEPELSENAVNPDWTYRIETNTIEVG